MAEAFHARRPVFFRRLPGIHGPGEHVGRRHEQSKAFNLKSINAVAMTIWILIVDIYWSKRDFPHVS